MRGAPQTLDPALLEAIVDAGTVAVIGASSNPEALSGRPIDYLRHHGYRGRVYPVNPMRPEVQGHKSYPSISDVPETVDLAMVAVRAELVPGALRECIDAGVRAAVIVSSGFGEGRGDGAALRDEIRSVIDGQPIRVLGPNCEGILSVPNRMPLTFSPVLEPGGDGRGLTAGDLAIVSQSGGLGYAVAQAGAEVGLGVNYVFSTGNEVDLDVLAVAEAAVERRDVRLLALIFEGFDDHARAVRLGRRARALGKHVVAAKLGRSAAGRGAARRHTCHDAGEPATYQALLAEAGIHEAVDQTALVDALQVLAKARPMAGTRVAIVTTSGGAGVWMADACDAVGLDVPVLSDALRAAISSNLPGYGSPHNPVDLTAQFFTAGTFTEVLEALSASGEVDAAVVVTSLTSTGRLERERDGMHRLLATHPMPLVVFTYTAPAPTNVEILWDLGVPYFPSSRRAAEALACLARAGAVIPHSR